jgi:hypothetical protein
VLPFNLHPLFDFEKFQVSLLKSWVYSTNPALVQGEDLGKTGFAEPDFFLSSDLKKSQVPPSKLLFSAD